MAKYISLDNCLSFLENKCYYFLDSSTKEQCKQNCTTIFSKNDYHIIVKEYTLRDDGYTDEEKSFDIGQVDRVHLKDRDKDKFAIILNQYFEENIEKIKVTYKNLFHESKSIVISREYSNRTVSYLEEEFNNIEEKIKDSALKIFNFCEHVDKKKDWIDKIEREDRLEQIPFLSVEDIEYFHSKKITKITEIPKMEKDEDKNIYENMPEGLKDKFDDIQEWLKNKDKNIPTCNHKYYLNWIKFDQNNTEDEKCKNALEVKYAVNFEGHSGTDIVYAFSYQQMYEIGAGKKHIILKNREKSKKFVLEHYRNIVIEIYDLLKNKASKKEIVFVTLAPYARKNFEKVIETILEYKSEFDQETINKTLNVSEYFGFDYYLEGEAITYVNPYVDTWIDLKNVIEKYICTGISVINSFIEVYSKLCNVKLSSESLNSHNYSWALKPQYINQVWEGKSEEQEKAQENLTKELDMKLSNINKLYGRLYPKEGLLRNIMIYPKKREFTNDGSFMSRFMLKETISSIKEYKQELADYSFDRLVEKGLILELTNVEFKEEEPYEENGHKKVKYHYTFDYDEKSDFDNNGMIEYFYKKEGFEEVLKRSFHFDNLLDLDFDKKSLIIKNRKLENKTLYVIKSIFDTVEDITKKDGSNNIINNTEKVLQNLGKNNTVKFDKNMKPDEDFYFLSELEGKQKEVFQSIIANKFTLLLGPPGTGKTYTIAKVVNELSKKYPNKKFLITGFTNLSIENCLFKIINEGKEKQKVGKWKEVKDKKYIGKINPSCRLENIDILGSTIYQFNKFTVQKFDFIIVDEASQMKIPEFLMTNQVAKEDTHFLIVGDDNQLPPIIKNKYLNSDKSDKNKILEAKSIFSYVDEKNPSCIIKLNRCYRMNKVLCEYPEKEIYHDFKPAKNEISSQKLELSYESRNLADDKNYLFKILNPDYPVVLCLVDNKGKKGNSSKIEAELCAEISRGLYDNFQNRNNSENTSFWGKNLAIVSPHHAHIRKIKKELSEIFNGEEEKEYFVDTVDKMQGQEADAIIVSYGVTDPQIAFKEKEFIYNRNRLNVSITRAKSKLIVLLSKELLDINRRLMDDENLKEHVDFMVKYVEYLKGNKENHKILEEKDFTLYGIPFDLE